MARLSASEHTQSNKEAQECSSGDGKRRSGKDEDWLSKCMWKSSSLMLAKVAAYMLAEKENI